MQTVPPAKDKDGYRLEHHPEFLRRVAEARAEIAAGKGVPFRPTKGRRSLKRRRR
jgi:hypothetical protein